MNKIFISTLSLYCLSIYSLSGKEFNVDEYFPGLPTTISFDYVENTRTNFNGKANEPVKLNGSLSYNFVNGAYNLKTIQEIDSQRRKDIREVFWDGKVVKHNNNLYISDKCVLAEGGFTNQILTYGQFPNPLEFIYTTNLPQKPLLYSEILREALSQKIPMNLKKEGDTLTLEFEKRQNTIFTFKFDKKNKILSLIKTSVHDIDGNIEYSRVIKVSDYVTKSGYRLPTKIEVNIKSSGRVNVNNVIKIDIVPDSIKFNNPIIDTIAFVPGTIVRDTINNKTYKTTKTSTEDTKEELIKNMLEENLDNK